MFGLTVVEKSYLDKLVVENYRLKRELAQSDYAPEQVERIVKRETDELQRRNREYLQVIQGLEAKVQALINKQFCNF